MDLLEPVRHLGWGAGILCIMETPNPPRRPYPSDVSDAEWAFVAPYLSLMTPEAPQRHHDLREVVNALRWLARSGASWRMLPHDLPRWEAVYQQTQRWFAAGCFQAIIDDLRLVLRLAAGRNAQPSAASFDSQTLQSTPESGSRAGYDGHKRKQGSELHLAVDTLGHRLALQVTPANEPDRTQVGVLAAAVQEATGEPVELVYVDQGYTGDVPTAAAADHGIELHVVKLSDAKHGFVLLPRRWVAERSFAWKTRFRRLVRDYERLQTTVEGLHLVAFSCLMLHQALPLLTAPASA